MAMRSSITTLLGGAMLAAVLTPAGTAYAAGLTVTDGTAYVWESTDQAEYVASAQVDNVDVQSLRVRHLANRIVVTASYVELVKDADVTLVVSNVLRFDDGPAVTIMVDTFQKASGESVLYTRRGPVDCGGFDATIDYAADTVELVVPRTCVGTPRWVEANYVALGNAEGESEDGPTYTNYRDNALTTGSGTGGWTERVRRG